MDNVIKTGNIVRVTRDDGRVYQCYVVDTAEDGNLFFGRILESSKDKVPHTSWSRYGLKDNCICQVIGECKSIDLISEGLPFVLEDMSGIKFYRNKIPGSGTVITLCLSEDRKFGGWSDDSDDDSAIIESYHKASEASEAGQEDFSHE